MIVHYAHVLLKTADILVDSWWWCGDEAAAVRAARTAAAAASLGICLGLAMGGSEPSVKAALEAAAAAREAAGKGTAYAQMLLALASIVINVVLRLLILREMRRGIISQNYAPTVRRYSLFVLLIAAAVMAAVALSVLMDWTGSAGLTGPDTEARCKRIAIVGMVGAAAPAAAAAAHPGVRARLVALAGGCGCGGGGGVAAAAAAAAGATLRPGLEARRIVAALAAAGKVAPEVTTDEKDVETA